jgi:hypothetical protein
MGINGRRVWWCVAFMASSPFARPTLRAQGIASSAVVGTVRAGDSLSGDAEITVTHIPTGFLTRVAARKGRFLIEGLEPGGPYTIVARQIGFTAQIRTGISLKLGERLPVDFVLRPLISELDTVRIVGREASVSFEAGGGTGTTIGDAMLHGLPTLNRDLYDFVRLVPQISTRISLANPGFSAGGVGFRFNNFFINGVSERTISGNVSSAFGGSKSIPIDAVEEYQVLIAPYDVRYGDFTGALVNAVTRSGTNRMRGSAFAYARNDRLAGRTSDSLANQYDQIQYGFSIGGPIIRDRVHFFVSSELQEFTFPAVGPYVGQPGNAAGIVPVKESDLARLTELMHQRGLIAGSAGPVTNGHPQRNIFSRVDAALPKWRTRAAFSVNYSGSKDLTFSRAARDTFSLSSNSVTAATTSTLTALEMHTALPRSGGGHNELRLAIRSSDLNSQGEVDQPIVRVAVPGVSGRNITINTGTHEAAQLNGISSSSLSIKDNLTIPLGASHVVTFGAEAETFAMKRRSIVGAYGAWTFASLDDLEMGTAERYEVAIDFGASRGASRGAEYTAYVSDRWTPGKRVLVTMGLRADLLAIAGSPQYNQTVDSIFGRRTDRLPHRRVEPAPRVGIIWDVAGDTRHMIRAGAGMFTARYPLAWVHTAFTSYGSGNGFLVCGRTPGDLGPPPAFTTDYRAPPTACANGATPAENARGDVDLLHSDLRMMRTLRGSLAYERTLLTDTRVSGEILGTRSLSDFVFQNLNLAGPVTTDRNGRVMYGTLSSSGISAPARRSGFAEVIELRNKPHSYSYQYVARVEKNFRDRLSGSIFYVHSRVRDAQTPLRVNTRGTVAWSSARVISGRQDDYASGVSSNDITHRFVAYGMFATRRPHWRTELSLYYVGESGRPFTYLATGTVRRGDLNADGSNANDPIYVPLDARDNDEITFSGSADDVARQQAALENLIESTRCLREQRGRIMKRNSCREPWSNTTIASIKQTLPIGGRKLELQFDVYNFLHLANAKWGLRREAVPSLLEHLGQTPEPLQTSRSIFKFGVDDPRWTTNPTESTFQLQLAARYAF